MAKRRNFFLPDEPLCSPGHHRPRTRRELIAQGFTLGTGTVLASSMLSLLPQRARALDLSADLQTAMNVCTSSAGVGPGMIPFLCFDLAGGANFAGSNILIGGRGGQLDFLSTAGYSTLGLPSSMLPGSSTTNFVNTECGLSFHSLSALLAGIKLTASPAALANTNGAVIAARSENDTSNNPHNPMYGIYRAGVRGSLVNLIGSQNTDSGGNSMAPTMLVDVSARPTKVDSPSDVTGLVGTSSSYTLPLAQADTVAAMESMKRISDAGIDAAGSQYGVSVTTRNSPKCEILKSADNTARFGGTSPDPTSPLETVINGDGSNPPIFPGGLSSSSDREFLKTASVMKMVIGTPDNSTDLSKRYAAAGTITMGGYDYHTGDRTTGEMRDKRAGQCIGACLEYAKRLGMPLMLYVFSDGSISSSGMTDSTGKGVWTSDNQGTGSAFFLVYNPNGRTQAIRQQIGWFKMDGTVDTTSSPAANSVTQLVDTIVLNYLALHGRQNLLSQALAMRAESTILGGAGNWDSYTAFPKIVP